MISKIFISYRRDDTAGYAGRLYDQLCDRFGKENIFMDIGDIKPGQNFVQAIQTAVGSCNVLLALIGKQWLSITDKDGNRRLDEENDFVRLEVSNALNRNILVIPLLLRGAAMPSETSLPENMKPLVVCNAIELSDTRWDYDVGRLFDALTEHIEEDQNKISPVPFQEPSEQRRQLEIPRELKEQFSNGSLVLFIGANFSELAGLPSQIELVRGLAEAIDNPLPPDKYLTANHLLDTLEMYETQYGRHSLINHFRNNLNTIRIQPSLCHRLIAKFSIKTIFTTTYDDLLEKSLTAEGKVYNKIVTDTNLAYDSPNTVNLIKLKGEYQNPESMRITRSDYNTFSVERPALINELKARLVTSTFLFLGYDLNDPDFDFIFDHISHQMGNQQRMGYTVLFDVSSTKIDHLRKRGINAINLATSESLSKEQLLENWLRGLVS